LHFRLGQKRGWSPPSSSSLSEAARRALEAKMQSGSYQYQSEFVRKFIAQGRAEGREEGRQEGRQEGLEEGQEKGRLEGGLMALFKVLDARGLEVDDASRQRLMACTDLSQLEEWLREAVTVRSVQELFERKHSSKPTARMADTQRRHLKSRKPRSKR
jgi:Arc/MetJ-type ribon-helix-helix transcriptional regulator